MLYRDIRFNINLAFVVITLMGASTAQASLLDCSLNPAVNSLAGSECSAVADSGAEEPAYAMAADTPSVPVAATQASFEIDQTRRAGLTNSVPLLLLIGVFIAFLLLRAKRFNTK